MYLQLSHCPCRIHQQQSYYKGSIPIQVIAETIHPANITGYCINPNSLNDTTRFSNQYLYLTNSIFFFFFFKQGWPPVGSSLILLILLDEGLFLDGGLFSNEGLYISINKVCNNYHYGTLKYSPGSWQLRAIPKMQ